ncbi:hypothetical protein SCA6_015960 [Theobroma cacao]
MWCSRAVRHVGLSCGCEIAWQEIVGGWDRLLTSMIFCRWGLDDASKTFNEAKPTYLQCFFLLTLPILDELRDNFLLLYRLGQEESWRGCASENRASELTC